jgi:hypothetical protein
MPDMDRLNLARRVLKIGLGIGPLITGADNPDSRRMGAR